MTNEAWAAQSQSLVRVQREGGSLEDEVGKVLGWSGGKLIYDKAHGYTVQVDALYPSLTNPGALVSSTYTNPDTPGHSNENKLHLKVGELALLKNLYPELRMVLAIGGSGDTWLPYVLDVFQHFYDEVLFLWNEEHRQRLPAISHAPESVPLRNQNLWSDMQSEWSRIELVPVDFPVPRNLLRYQIVDLLRAQTPRAQHPLEIANEIARRCMQLSYERSGAEWRSYQDGRWNSIEESRNFFNPLEAAVEISLTHAHLRFDGGVAQDVPVPSLLHELGYARTSVAEDFVLYSNKYQMPVYIQCKASGGGRKQTGKNIQNRGKEQITRSLIYRCHLVDGKISWAPKRFHWISVLDGNWAVSKKQPAKYIHMLQLAGYDRIFGSADLVTPTLEVRRDDNPLIHYLIHDLECQTEQDSARPAQLVLDL